ncbi:MAG TPA: SDR family oxidoreductase [Solirubrobacteraceae bacterium]|nr:SDR family oxidoreductase [Solirubrobacteraceae bacterium]
MPADAARPLAGEVALVTGARGRLGPVWTAALQAAGADVIGIDVEDADVRDRAALEALRDGLGAAPTILVNNAGIDQPPDAGAQAVLDHADFLRVLDVNLAGAFNAMLVFGEPMAAAGRGAIVNIGSLYASISPEPSFYDHMEGFLKPPAYGASKAGLVQLTKYFARLWGPRGVRVNALSPGGVRGGQDDEFLRKYCARVPLGRMAEADDLGGPLVFLASDAARYLTGHELRVDGGFTA